MSGALLLIDTVSNPLEVTFSVCWRKLIRKIDIGEYYFSELSKNIIVFKNIRYLISKKIPCIFFLVSIKNSGKLNIKKKLF